MTTPEGFEWKGVRFGWSTLRSASMAHIELSGRLYWFLVRETLPGAWESWVEFEGGYTAPCTMATSELALEGSALALKDFFVTTLKDLEPFATVPTEATFGGCGGWLPPSPRCGNTLAGSATVLVCEQVRGHGGSCFSMIVGGGHGATGKGSSRT